MSFERYSGVLKPNLFLQTPLVEAHQESDIKPTTFSQLTKSIINLQDLEPKDNWRSYIQIANIASELIIEYDKVRDEEDLLTVFQLWNIRLTMLLFSNELALAQQESKRLSSVLDAVAREESGTVSKKPIGQYVNLFPKMVPFSLKILLVRLRSIGPNVMLTSEYHLLLWPLREQYLQSVKDKDEGTVAKCGKIIKILAYGVSSNLIAKREYSTFLTHADSIINSLGTTIDSDDKLYKEQISFLGMLVSLVKGDWDLSVNYYSIIETNFKIIIESLQYILNHVNPVLDYKIKDGSQEKQVIDLNGIESLDDVFGLIKDQLITGRILCSLCSLFELKLRDQGDSDLFDDDDNTKGSYELLKLWFKNPSKLHGFE